MWWVTKSATANFLIFHFFFFNDTATTEIYTLSLHDALPICELGGTKGVGEAFSLTNLTNRHNFKRGRAEIETDDS